MKSLDKKIKAFTISEMLVVLVISSVVVGLSLTVLSLVQKQVGAINENYKKNTEMQQLERVLTYDFQRYELFYNSKNDQLKGMSVTDTVVYHFNENFIIRNTDTLYVSIAKMIKYLDGNLVTENSIDALELQWSKDFPEKKLFISKIKDAAFYMNNNGI